MLLLRCGGLLSRRSWVQIPPGPPGFAWVKMQFPWVDYEEHVLRRTTVTLRLLPKTMLN